VAVNGAAIKWKRRFSADFDAFLKYAGQHPESQVARGELVRLVWHPMDQSESNPIKPNQGESS